ncbi:MAG: threonine/serine dehydratase [Candidatus Thorarchaeota archaeon]
MKSLTLEAVLEAEKAIRGYVKRTPLIRSDFLSAKCEGDVFLKFENQQHTNSFKFRGALNRLSHLSADEKTRGVVTASSGNHAQAMARAAQELGIPATIVVPLGVSKVKLEKIQKYDVEVIQEGGFDEVEPHARALAKERGQTYISPYNDYGVMAGQGTIGLEIFEVLGDVDSIIVPVGGGGLISGISVAAKGRIPDVEIIGVQTRGSSTMYHSWVKGVLENVEEFDTLAEAFLGGVEEGSLTFEVIMKFVDEMLLVQEKTVAAAMRILWNTEKQVVEGAGATSLGPILEHPERFSGKRVVAIVSGGNIEQSLFDDIISDRYQPS